MRHDLLHAQASIEWVLSNLTSLQTRTSDWIKANLYLGYEDAGPDSTNEVLVLCTREPLPLQFSVEVGAYINAIRSSLDILVVALAERHGLPNPGKICFPFSQSESEFKNGRYYGSKEFRYLPDSDQNVISSLKPYSGGNEKLFALHELDIIRKHRRLLSVEASLSSIKMSAWGLSENFTPLSNGPMRDGGRIILGLLKRGAPKPKTEFTAYVALDEPAPLGEVPLVPALKSFAELATDIIKLFDG